MSARWTIRRAQPADALALAPLRCALWPDEDAGWLPDNLDAYFDQPRAATWIARDEGGTAIGFAEASLRHDYVNGTATSPVGFLEGWYVAPAWRGCGLGRALVAEVESWTREQGCTELASDALLDNQASLQAHVACGFVETERVVYFRKAV